MSNCSLTAQNFLFQLKTFNYIAVLDGMCRKITTFAVEKNNDKRENKGSAERP